MKRAFTLIELLVVIGILAILSAIAVSNYADAHVRAKTARVMADMRALAGAIEQYRVDHNRTARMAHYRFFEDPVFDVILGESANGVVSIVLSTPVPYITQAFILDPFMLRMAGAAVDERLYTYQDLDTYAVRNPESAFWPAAREAYGPYRLGSVGPDLTFDHGFANSAQLPYDPTNGTISLGNIWHCQRGGFDNPDAMRSDLLGEHH